MKNKIIALLLMFSSTLAAYYNGNPADPALIENAIITKPNAILSKKVSYIKDWTIDQKMNRSSGPQFDSFALYSDSGMVAINIIKRFYLYYLLGAAKIESKLPITPSEMLAFKSKEEFAWGVGASALAIKFNNICVGVDGKFFSTRPHIKALETNGSPYSGAQRAKYRYDAWQVGMGFAYQGQLLSPYIGAKYSNVTGKFKKLPAAFTLPAEFNFKNRCHFGMVVGMTLAEQNYFSCNVEARLIDENALTATASIMF